jgi:hypothetical protein
MNMEELDLLKKDWKKNQHFEQISESEIYKMLHQKSSSIVKWILILSVLEIVLWSVVGLFFNTDDFLKNIKNETLDIYIESLTVFNSVVVLVFIYLFYKNYKTISSTVSIKELMKSILKTRKTVNLYVGYNLIMIAFGLLFGFYISIMYHPDVVVLRDQIGHSGKIMFITVLVFVLVTVLLISLFWLFYKLIYGSLLRRLFANYKELKKIDL